MFKVGLSGGIGSGKSTATDILSGYGVDIVDADRIAHEVLMPEQPALDAVIQYFGQHLLKEDGRLNRSALREIIFTNCEHKCWLERLLHPIIRQRIIAQMQCSTAPYCVLVSPLLLETEQQQLVDYVVIVRSSRALQLQRTCLRDQSDSQLIELIIEQQMDVDRQCNLADYVLDNCENIEVFTHNISVLHHHILHLLSLRS